MKLNEADWDRVARFVLGVALILGGSPAVGTKNDESASAAA